LDATEGYFDKTISVCEESDSDFQPQEGMFTLAQQVAHVAQTIDWFLDGMFSDRGFDLNFEAHQKVILMQTSLNESKKWLAKSFEEFRQKLQSVDDEVLKERLPPGPIMGGVPRYIIVGALSDHTAHHRGSLSVYIRMTGKIPPMPYE
jgi:uncharacterized damage-inducible protein DinB